MDWNFESLHILAMSRKENDIEVVVQPLVTCQLSIQSGVVNADIRVHIRERLSNDHKSKKWLVNVQVEIEDT